MTPRRILFWLHLSAGVFAGVVILIMSVTGVILAYQRQILNWSQQREYRSAPPLPNDHPLPASQLLTRARAAHPEFKATRITISSDSSVPAVVQFGREATVYLNPYTGAVLGDGSTKLRSFFRKVNWWHRWLGEIPEQNATGRWITGVANFLFAILVFSGPFLWWPKNWNLAALRQKTFFIGGLSGRARDFNWHNTIGFWCAVPLCFIVLSGVVMSFPWANNLLFRLNGSTPPPEDALRGEPTNNYPLDTDLDLMWAKAEQQVVGWRTISLQVPVPSESSAEFSIDQSYGGHPDRRSTLDLDIKTAGVVLWEPWSALDRGRQMRAWVRFGHTGEAGGVLGETIALIASSGGAFLVWTGLSMALRRLARWNASRSIPEEEDAGGGGEPAEDSLT
jgi:uncharacterized iron-regulated membrane protein